MALYSLRYAWSTGVGQNDDVRLRKRLRKPLQKRLQRKKLLRLQQRRPRLKQQPKPKQLRRRKRVRRADLLQMDLVIQSLRQKHSPLLPQKNPLFGQWKSPLLLLPWRQPTREARPGMLTQHS